MLGFPAPIYRIYQAPAHKQIKDSGLIILKGGSALKAKFPKGVPVQIKVVNGDGDYAITSYTR